MWNAGSTPARMIEVISPAGFEKYFRDLVDLTTEGAPPSRQSRHSQRPTDCNSANPHGYPTSSPATTSPRRDEREPAPHRRRRRVLQRCPLSSGWSCTSSSVSHRSALSTLGCGRRQHRRSVRHGALPGRTSPRCWPSTSCRPRPWLTGTAAAGCFVIDVASRQPL
jgi:hypothetical protein